MRHNMNKKIGILLILILLLFSGVAKATGDATLPLIPELDPNLLNNPPDATYPIQLAYIFTVLTMAPSLLLLMTGFTRIVIILSFVRNAMGIQQTPPNIVIVGLSLFLTFFVMSPIISDVNEKAVVPYLNEEITWDVAVNEAEKPIKEFMFRQTRPKDLNLFLSIKGISKVENLEEIPMHVLVPAFAISELKSAFQIGFVIFIPFLVIDMVIASILMAMGMMMLPPVIISLPFKILLFLLVDGWNLVIGSIVQGFR